jgi:hypothetical protein
MAGLVPAIHVFLVVVAKAWMPGTSPGMTTNELQSGLARNVVRAKTEEPST